MSINSNEDVYLNVLRDVLENGESTDDRTGVGTISLFGRTVRYDLSKGFPLLTTKEMKFKSVVSELLWFIEGSGDERRLAEIRYGKPREELVGKRTIWSDNAEAPYWKPKAKFEGDLGRVYGVNWRGWKSTVISGDDCGMHIGYHSTDQLKNLIEGIKKDPNGRRHILTAWNPGELSQMALPPCHVLTQYSVKNGKLSCLLYQRSVDTLLGKPYNVASYALFTMMIAQVCSFEVGDLIVSMGDVHIYKNHIEQVKEQLSREPLESPTVEINPGIKNIDDFTMESFTLMNYKYHPPIKAPMAV